jgi:molecular chaperone GrpE
MPINKAKNTEEENIATIAELQAELTQATLAYSKEAEEVIQLKDQILRLAADSENLRKRAAKQVDDAGKFAINNFAKDLIDVLENLYLATNNIPSEVLDKNEHLSAIFKGVEMTKSTFLNVFDKYGIKRIFPDPGESFNHDIHEAVAQIDQPEFADNAIINVMRAGYTLHDRLIKPAMVVVAKAK